MKYRLALLVVLVGLLVSSLSPISSKLNVDVSVSIDTESSDTDTPHDATSQLHLDSANSDPPVQPPADPNTLKSPCVGWFDSSTLNVFGGSFTSPSARITPTTEPSHVSEYVDWAFQKQVDVCHRTEDVSVYSMTGNSYSVGFLVPTDFCTNVLKGSPDSGFNPQHQSVNHCCFLYCTPKPASRVM